MQKHFGWLWIVGFFGLVAATDAQAPPAAMPVTKYDGTYAFVSSAKVSETYTDRSGRLKHCGNLAPRTSLTIANGHARFNLQEGMVTTRGELATRNTSPSPVGGGGFLPGWDVIAAGRIDEDGTVHARWSNYNCSYDLVWQKSK